MSKQFDDSVIREIARTLHTYNTRYQNREMKHHDYTKNVDALLANSGISKAEFMEAVKNILDQKEEPATQPIIATYPKTKPKPRPV